MHKFKLTLQAVFVTFPVGKENCNPVFSTEINTGSYLKSHEIKGAQLQ